MKSIFDLSDKKLAQLARKTMKSIESIADEQARSYSMTCALWLIDNLVSKGNVESTHIIEGVTIDDVEEGDWKITVKIEKA